MLIKEKQILRTTLNDLKEINLNATILSESMTDAEWQDYFARMKIIVVPAKTKNMQGSYSARLKEGEAYQGDTQAYRYKQFINSILKTIRSGEADYAFYIFQISDLLRYEPNLKAQWLPNSECFKVSL